MKNRGLDPSAYDATVSSIFLFIALVVAASFLVGAYGEYKDTVNSKQKIIEPARR